MTFKKLPKLDRCPHCASRDISFYDDKNNQKVIPLRPGQMVQASCDDCCASTGFADSYHSAATLWNRRA